MLTGKCAFACCQKRLLLKAVRNFTERLLLHAVRYVCFCYKFCMLSGKAAFACCRKRLLLYVVSLCQIRLPLHAVSSLFSASFQKRLHLHAVRKFCFCIP